VIVFAALSGSVAVGLLACGSSGTGGPTASNEAGADGAMSDATAPDGGASEASMGEAPLGEAAVGEASVGEASVNEASVGDGNIADSAVESTVQEGAAPSRLLLSFNSYAGAMPCELAAFDLASQSVAGRLDYTGFGTTYVGSTAPWLLEQAVDIVARLDDARPWVIDSSWNVAQAVPDASDSYADPQAVIVAAGTKAYVLPYNRNAISVIDTSSGLEGGVPTKTIDLSALVQAGGDGTLEMTAGAYVPGKNRVYVLLGNIDQNAYNGSDNLGCAGSATPTVIAIDTTTDTLVGVDGGAGTSGVPLPGRNPPFGQGAMAYDAVADRLLVLQSGCVSVAGDGGSGPVVGAEVDQLSLATGGATVLLDLTGKALPAQLVYMDAQNALVQLGAEAPFTTYTWNPTTTALGSAIPNAPDSFAWDGAGNLLGVAAVVDSDSGATTGYDVVSVKISDGTLTKLASNPFSIAVGNGSVSGVQLWPAL
jgi:hypothetical protein